jgi:4-alpha-glucanotransferase
MDDTAILSSRCGKIWQHIGLKSHQGIDVPLFSIHTKESAGIGEFLDLIPLINWCKKNGLDVIQLLPLNDSGNDPSPYNALSSCALNPLFLSISHLPHTESNKDLDGLLSQLKTLTQSEKIAYEEVRQKKMQWLRLYFEKQGAFFFKQKLFADFVQTNPWLKPYALFKTLKDRNAHQHWLKWPEEQKKISPQAFETYLKTYENDVQFYIFLQFLCFLQLKTVREHARAEEILLKGDIPILISSDSADVWNHPNFFDQRLAAGAPPDPYNMQGQYWGFPLFNWAAMEKEGYSWWRQRLSFASQFYDLYRIDHVVGFFRIWAIPLGESPQKGRFVPEDKALWIPQGKKLLEMMIDASSMLPLAEDLGTVPPEVRECLKELGICGTKVIRWERRWNGDKSFIPFEEYPPLSLTCVSTHDSEPLALWWKTNSEEVKAFAAFKHWEYTPQLTFEQREELLRDSHHTPSFFHINLLQEYLALFPELSWATPEEERINIPGVVLPSNWTYRFRPSIETIAAHSELSTALKAIL